MGRDNDYSDRRRGSGFGVQPTDPWVSNRTPRSFDQRPTGSGWRAQASSGRETEAKVKWFNAERGFGFVELTDGSGEAFLHIRPVEAAGHSTLEPGATLRVRVGQGPKGAQVTEVHSVDPSTAEPAQRRGERAPLPRLGRERSFAHETGPSEERDGQVKWFNPDKGFGFVIAEGSKDIFVHRSVLMRAGLSDLRDGQRVRVKVVQGQKGPEATSIEIAD